jgi:fructose-1,6-bisphosphatase/inositol monophosphatase family enzyme
MLSEASVYTTTVDMFDEDSQEQANRLTKSCKFRVFGGDCYGYGLIASGFNDLVCEADLKPYDYFALIPVIEGAGGVITDWQGEALTMESSGQVLAAANPALHQQAVDRLNSG